jgi:hypothetical protein
MHHVPEDQQIRHTSTVNDYTDNFANNNNDNDDTNVNNMMIGTDQSPVQGRPPMYLTGVVSGTGVHILVNTGSTHNIINSARLIGRLEQRINNTILVGSSTKVSCWAASFNVPLHIDAETPQIEAFLFDISNDIDIMLGTPW